MKIQHIIVGLNIGGAEMMLKRLIDSHRGNPTYQHTVISLTDVGKIGAQLQAVGVEVRALAMRNVFDIPRVIWQLVRLIRASSIDIVQTWMYHADLLGGVSARLAGNRNVIWGIHSTYVQAGGSPTTTWVMHMCAWLSRWVPHTILCVAEMSRRVHVAAGYQAERILVLPNGIDLSRMVATADQCTALRSECGFSENNIVIGTLGRFNPAKDYQNFVHAAGLLAERNPHVRFLMIGLELDGANATLAGWIAKTGHADRFVLLGERADAAVCLAAMDVFCLSSRSEALPTVVAEAMAMSVPCVVTDVGDTALLVAATGVVVRKEDSIALANGLEKMLAIPTSMRRQLGEKAKERIQAEFTIEQARTRFETLYQQIISEKKGSR